MGYRKIALLLASALGGAQLAPAYAQSAEPAMQSPMDIIVTARRTEERLQDVPLAVSVITPAQIESRGSFDPVDLALGTPGLTVTASVSQRSNLTYTIRGQGFSFGTVFPAVITYFNEVPIAQLTQGTFFDIANIQVLRGPQGVGFGRVTDGGNVMVAPQVPQEEFGGYAGGRVGNYGLRAFNGAINIPLIEDTVLFRAAFETTRRDGFTENLANGQDLDNVAYEGYRVGLTLRPNDRIENTTIASYLRTHDNGTGMVFAGFNPQAAGLLPAIGNFSGLFAGGYGIDAHGSVVPMAAGLAPLTAESYAASQQAQLAAQQARGTREISLVDPLFSRRRNLYVVNTTTVDVSDNIQVKNIFGYVREKEYQASNFGGANGASVLTCVSACPGAPYIPFRNAEQFSEELRVSGNLFDNRLTWAIGGYMDEQRPGGEFQNTTINVGILNRVGVNYIKTKSRAIYGSGEYAVTDNFKLNAGLRYTHDTVHSEQNNYLSPIPGGEDALRAFLMGPFGGSLSEAVANQVVAATFAPIPHGKCETYGQGSVLYPAGAGGCLVNDGKFNATTWSFGANYQTDAGQLLYAKVSKGYRPGGVNSTAPVGMDPKYAPETNISIELGVKADFHFDDVFLRTNLAFFRDRYKDIQKNVVLPGPVPMSLVQNVNDAKIKGVEAEVTLIPVEGLTLGGTFAYTDAKYDDVPLDLSDPTVVAGNPCDPTRFNTVGFCPANKFSNTPKTQFTLNASYVLPLSPDVGEVSIGGLLYHVSDVSLTDTSVLNPDSIEPSYTTIDLNANWRNVMGQPVDLGFFVTNVTNKLYRIGANNLLHNSSLGTLANIYAPPRMWGFSLKYRFGSDAR